MADNPELEEALAVAHLPALVLSLVHMTGDPSLLKDEWKPTYDMFPRGEPILSDKVQAEIRDKAREVISAHLAGTLPKAEPLSVQTVRKMIDFIAGAEIPAHYVDFLTDELAIEGPTSKDPHWETPQLKSAAKAMKVVVVGAGMSGLLTGIRLDQAGIAYTIIEKNPEVGGTWFENQYPGCRVDSSNHMYSYSFEPNHQWPQHFSTQPVLLDYFKRVSERYDLRKNIRFETTVQEASWDEARGLWRVRVTGKDGKEEVLEANAVISAVGQLNRPRFPDIKGLGSFKGPAFHSAEWRKDVDLAGKRVGIIGTGASAFQIVPEIAGKVQSLTIFQRTPPWVFPNPNYHADVPEGMKWMLENAPFFDKWYRFSLFWSAAEGLLEAVKADPGWNGPPTAVSAINQEYRNLVESVLQMQTDGDPELFSKVVPAYPLGGKRGLVDNGVWVESLRRENVSLLTSPIAEINETGVKTSDGVQHDFDVLIYGTGFHASKFLMPMRIKGRGGQDLHEKWAGDPRAYLGMTTPGFPNFFMIYGPNTNIVVNGSIIFFSECSVRYIINALKLVAENGAKSIEVRQDVHDDFNAKVDAANKLMAWGAPQVTSWYKNEAGRVTQNWPFALIDYWRATLAPDPKDFLLDGGQKQAA